MTYLIMGWGAIIALCILMYVILDGFTLGAGILLPFIRKDEDRDIVFSSVLPNWDGNQTWLVLSGASLYGAFPTAFSTLLPTLYLPLILMVVCLLFRGVTFEFRLKAKAHNKRKWEALFTFGSIAAAFLQGLLLGTFVKGFGSDIHYLVVPAYKWLTPFSITTGVSVIFGYALLGATRLIGKTTGELQEKYYKLAKVAIVIVALFMVAISIWTPFVDPTINSKWFNPARMPYLAILPIVTGIVFIWCWIAIDRRHEYWPFWLSVTMFICAYIGFGYSSWPYIVPHAITIWQAASPRYALAFTMVGAVIMIPVLMFYTFSSYRIFKGKIKNVIEY